MRKRGGEKTESDQFIGPKPDHKEEERSKKPQGLTLQRIGIKGGSKGGSLSGKKRKKAMGPTSSKKNRRKSGTKIYLGKQRESHPEDENPRLLKKIGEA